MAMSSFSEGRRDAPFGDGSGLSERQESIIRRVMEGVPYKAIAAELGITERT